MKRRMRLLIAAALFGLCGCHNGNFYVKEAGSGIPLSECNLVGGMEKCLAADDVIVALDGGYAPELPAPLDLVIPELRSRLGDRRLTVIRPPQDGIVTEWNLYALNSVFSGKTLPSRKGFLKERFGAAAPAMGEYFRLLERRIVAAGALCGVGRGKRPVAYDLYSGDFLPALAALLADAERLADTAASAETVRKEQRFFASRRRLAEERLEREIRRLRAGEGDEQSFTALYGDPADIGTTVRLTADAEKLTILLCAFEPLPLDRRISQIRERDYPNLWAEDGFEIFLVPDPERPAHGWQFIINSRGALWDAEHTRVGACDAAWNAPHAVVKVTELPDRWQAVLTIPWRDLGLTGKPERPFLANIYRNRAVRGARRRSYAWSPIYGGAYYQPSRFGLFIWREAKK